jgi:hypothetical protein
LSIEDELLTLARERDQGMQRALSQMDLDEPHIIRSQLRAYLARQVDRGRVKHFDGNVLEVSTLAEGSTKLTCRELAFTSGSKLNFALTLDRNQTGWQMSHFEFHVRLPAKRKVRMVRIDLNRLSAWHDALRIPICHFHVDESEPHLAFPIQNPRLLLHTLCEQIEPHFGS